MLKKIFTSPFFVFPLLTCLVFWPFTFQLLSLKNDALTYYYPIRTLISDALNNNELPLWSPFINMGYPLHADMQSGAWNPVIWVFSILTNYSLAAFHYELLFYISFAGIGFYFLCRELNCSKPVSFTMAIAYMFSGFIIDSVQFFPCISVACYVPYIFIFFRRIVFNFKLKDALLLAFFMFLLFTGGYPSLFIITVYALFSLLLFYFFSAGNKAYFLKRVSFPLIASFTFFILLSLPALISFVQHLPEIERGRSQPLSVVMENSMNPSTLISFISPFATTANDQWPDSSILMRSIYIGILPFIFFLCTFFNKDLRKNKEIIFFFVCGIIMLGLAFGKFFFLRQAVYYTLPLMKSFRHPALFRLFSIFFFLLIAARSMNFWVSSALNSKPIKKLIVFILILAATIGIASIFFAKNFSSVPSLNGSAVKELLGKLNFNERFLIQLPLVIGMLLLTYFFVIKKKSTQWICFIIFADMFIAAQLNMPVTVYGSKSFKTIEQTINRNPTKFPLPDDQSIEENSLNSFDPEFVAGSKLVFSKKIGRNDYFITPGNLSKQDEFYESPMKDAVFKNPVLYFADTIIYQYSTEIPLQTGIVFMDEPRINFKSSAQNSIEIKDLSANQLHATVSIKSNGLLIFLQNKYHGWKAFIDDKPVQISSADHSFMAIEVPPGEHSISFKYRPVLVINAWYISSGTFVLMIVLYCWFTFARRRSTKPRTGIQ